MRFVKMHGAGNDYIYVDCFDQPVPLNPPHLAVTLSDRHRGIGADGLILVRPSERADARMQMFNADGSEAEMCGNGVRCVAKYVFEQGIARKDALRIETGRGVLDLELSVSEGQVESVRVNMGRPILEGRFIPTTLPGDPPVRVPLEVAGRTLSVTCLSVGNPHCVVYVDELTDDWVHGIGPQIERHGAFPKRVNVEFVRVISPRQVEMRVWERGSGETQACGSGACAVVVAGVLSGVGEREIVCRQPGGQLQLQWADSGDIFMTGPAIEVFRGEWPDDRPL
ncbi:MAG: diaminopimelate epimerase [Planctomycetaceae bacterium]